MSLKNKRIIEKAVKIASFSLLILLVINFYSNFTKVNNNIKDTNNFNSAKNIINYKNSDFKPIANIAIAISTNLGIKYFEKSKKINLSNIYNTIYSSNEIIKNQKLVKENILGKNILFIKDYFNFIKTDFNKTLKNTNNKKEVVESILNQLKIRLKTANKNALFLLNQKKLLENDFNKITTNIEEIKSKIRSNYKNNNNNQLYQNLDDYYKEKYKSIVLNSYILFINDFIKKYYILNEYNKTLINVLELNKNALIKNSYVVIPKKGKELLKKYELLISEDSYKTKKQKNP